MLLSPASTSGSLPSQGGGGGFWNRFSGKGGGGKQPPPDRQKEMEMRQQAAQMALARQRLLTLCYGEMETVRLLPLSFAELDAVARDWTKPPPDAVFTLRVPVEYASLQAARFISGPYVYLTGEDSYAIATMGVQGLRVEIVSDAPPPPDEPPPPPPPPVLEMPATFALELFPGQTVALDTTVSSDELDMARMEDGTMVDGLFWGKLEIVHDGDTHKMDFSGTRLNQEGQEDSQLFSPDFMMDTRVITKLAAAAKPATAKCHLSILPPAQQYCDVFLSFSSMWKIGFTWPPAEPVQEAENKIKYFLRVHPGGAMEHFESVTTATSIYYEAIPDPGMLEPQEFVAPRNSFAMSFSDFVPHLTGVLDQLGMSMHARTNFIHNNISTFAQHKNIAYRFLQPRKIAAAIDISVTAESCVFTRLFLIWRGVSEEEMGDFAGAGEKEANQFNWREAVNWSELSKDQSQFRVLETSVLELT
ncbi:hypothetical protein PUNSTDRAFT_127081 [Punctularia strigosozonata HHB-11173 SS5]|uniref:uncharacterized protein n=1 Tax=Punctularia strigosozonata (strain HHB-11173) TaxID=741275 RepID=UPI0004418424|nr:uncharacterized protein PUNSTDRAFT_127081 [Punctularia strigosozonata HHB-11173 SS5]EIN07328.1 hypothetical protein PUNSTDRAFT_127081 [Punctularia strigosozonata HHB-11173 SS5]